MGEFHTDTPITGRAGSEDRLNRGEFTKRIADALALPPGSSALVVSLEGKWGYGKTSQINLIIRHLDTETRDLKPIIFSFNPWMIGSAERLVEEFLTQLASRIGLSDEAKEAEKLAKQLKAYSELFSVLKFVPGLQKPAGIIEKVLNHLRGTSDALAEIKRSNLEERRNSVVRAIEEYGRPIVVFIDDIDRLTPIEIFQMIRLVKAIADFPRTSFLLAFDPAYVEAGLAQQGISDARAYLDKLIQVRIHLPQIATSDIHRIATTELNALSNVSLTDSFEGDQRRLGEIYHLYCKPLLRSPRDIKRVFNRLRFSVKATQGEVAFSDLFGMEVLAIKAPVVYEHIRANPGAYTGQSLESELQLEKPEEYAAKFSEERTNALNTISNEDSNYVRELLDFLFPVLSGDSFSSSNQSHHRRFGRVAAADRLNIVLTFGLPSDEVSRKDIRDFVDLPERRHDLAIYFIENNRFERFIEHLGNAATKQPPKDCLEFIVSLARISEEPEIRMLDKLNQDGWNSGIIRKIWWIGRRQLENQPSDERFEVLIQLFSSKKTLTFNTQCLQFCLAQHGFYSKHDASPEDKCLCDADTLEQLKSAWFQEVEAAFKNRSILILNGNGSIIFLLRRLDSALAASLISPYLRSDEDLDNIARAFGPTGTDSVNGAYARISAEFIDDLGGVNQIRNRVEKRLKETPSLDMELKAIYKSIITGKKYYLSDATEGSEV